MECYLLIYQKHLTVRHGLLIPKLAAYGFDQPSLYFIFNYLSGRTQRSKVNNAYSSYTDIKYGVPHGSIVGPLFLILIFVIYFFGTINAT